MYINIIMYILLVSRVAPHYNKRKAGSIKSVKMREHSVNPTFSREILCVNSKGREQTDAFPS